MATEAVTVEVGGTKVTVDIPKPSWAKDDPELWDVDKMEKAMPLALKKLQDETLAELKAEEEKRMAALRSAFDKFDEDGSGELTTDEVVTILTRMGGGKAMSEEDARSFIQEFDRNGDGSLNVKEFVTAMGVMSDAAGLDGEEAKFAKQIAAGMNVDAGVTTGSISDSVDNARRVQIGMGITGKAMAQEEIEEGMENLKQSFDVFDTDGSGELSTDEVLTILTRMTTNSGGLSEEDAKEFITAFDRARRRPLEVLLSNPTTPPPHPPLPSHHPSFPPRASVCRPLRLTDVSLWCACLRVCAAAENGDGKLNVKEFVEAMGIMAKGAGLGTDAEDVDTFAEMIAEGETMDAGIKVGDVKASVEEVKAAE
jgi:Ca2+-binding EF-hand superfamily protein